MAKILIITGSAIVLHTILAILAGTPEITDYLPYDWFLDKPDNGEFFKIVPSNEPSYLWLYTIAFGSVIAALGILLLRKKTR